MPKEQKKIIIIVNTTLIGGHEEQTRNIIMDYLSKGTSLKVLCPSDVVCNYFKETGAEVCYVPFNVIGKLLKQITSVKKTAKLLAPFIVNTCEVMVSGGSIEATINPVLAVKLINKKTRIVSYVPMYIDRSIAHGWIGNIYNLMLNTIAKNTNEYLTVNRIQAYIIRRNTGIVTNYLQNRIRHVKMATRDFGPRLVYLGRFDDKQKDVSGLVRLLDHPENPYKNIVLIGDGPDRELILKEVKLVKNVIIKTMGWLNSEQLDEMIGTKDVLILNSKWEGEPLVVREFNAKGLRCIARNIAGVRGVIGRRYRYNNQRELLSILNSIYIG